MPIVELEELKQFPQVTGLFIGGCVDRGDGSRFRAWAHAHTNKNAPNYHWICVLSQRRPLINGRGGLSQLMLHEVAHILTDLGHVDKWRIKAREIGYRLPQRYKKKQRV